MKDMEGRYFLINGQERPLEQFDENLVLNGKTVYEVIRIMQGKPLFYNMHIKRLYNSAALAKCKLDFGESLLKVQIKKLISINDIKSGNVKIAFNNNNLYMFEIKHRYPTPEEVEKGVDVVIFRGERREPNIKLIDMDFRNRANEKIKEENAYEAVLVDGGGFITEGSRSNIFMVKGDTLITSPISDVLPGITRTIVIAAAKSLGITVLEEKVNCEDIVKLDGMFISGTSPKVLPVKKIGSVHLNSASNPMVLKLKSEYDKLSEQDIKNFQL